MNSFWLFRTNLRPLEYYHDIRNIDDFKTQCHDFYLLQGIWFLENDTFDEVVIWRLSPPHIGKLADIVFTVNGKKFVQRFVYDFNECIKYMPSPQVTFFRGGFKEYDRLVNTDNKFFGKSIYCGTGKRVMPQYGGKYSLILAEDNRDFSNGMLPFYKTANQHIFKPLDVSKIYDICWPCNFSQIDYKGQEFFIREISKSAYLQGLKIVHAGNMPEKGISLCKKYGVRNIEFEGYVSRDKLNHLINSSKFGIVTSNMNDGSPRVITETFCAGTPLLLRSKTRSPYEYKKRSIVFNDDNIEAVVKKAINDYSKHNESAVNTIKKLSMENICKENIEIWRIKNG